MRTFKKILLGFLLFLLLCAAGLAAWIFLVRPKTEQTDVGGQTSEETQMREYAEETEHVTFDEDSGFLFMDNEVIVILKENAEDTTAEEYFEDINAEVDESMADLGIYRLTFSSSMDFDELEELLDEINGESFVDEAISICSVRSVKML